MKWLSNLIHSVDRKNRHYVSFPDRLLQDFDMKHPEKSASQKKEIAKHQNIFKRSVRSKIDWS